MRKPNLAIHLLAFAILTSIEGGQSPARAQSTDVERIFERAVNLHEAGDIEGAINGYKAVLALRPDRVDARSNLGAAYVRLGRYEEAIEQYKRALAIDSLNTTIRFNLALAFYKSEYTAEAIEELTRVVASQPGNTNAVLLLADCHLRMGEYKRIIELLSPLEARYGDDRALAYLLGTALIHDNQVEKGQVLVDRILRGGDSAEARVLMGTAHMMAHDYPNALKEFERAIALNPKLRTAHSFYGQVLLKTGNIEQAMKAFRSELEIDPNSFESNLYLGVLLKQDQKNEEALAHLERARRQRPRATNARYFIGSLYVSLGKIAEAQHVLEEVIKEAPDFVEAHVSLAIVYYRLKRKEDGDRERAVIQKLNAANQAQALGAQDSLGPAYRGEASPKREEKKP
ncbi:MAG TPA: tetratricopeptide repeat protein [Blastocatellia bacterium]|nr:tetratricopeptide repeat protein [Blastocatellia bacterium]